MGLAAQEPPESAVVVVDQDRLFDASRFGRRILSEIDRRTDEIAAENREIETQLTAEERSLTDLRGTLPPEEFRARAEEFDERVQALRDRQDAKVRAVGRMREEAQMEFYGRVGSILSTLLSERGAAVLMDRRAVLSAAEGVDITDTAISRIDAAIGDGTREDDPPAE